MFKKEIPATPEAWDRANKMNTEAIGRIISHVRKIYAATDARSLPERKVPYQASKG